ncbi:hypothetical protein [Marinobacterium arenosum]|uniref:hypothetical protein n=1 Tax=Marinobacterium arenosum TaxID=2862496 RepID=UPI001C96C302|nr:hypothetical protein [Marinobacterium arenosum]MBY4678317.1 hypothetical protein [Marinobacterium arenosum]
MSVPHINLTCNKCGEGWSPAQLNKHRVYLDSDVEVPVYSTLGWCETCAALRPVEHFEDSPRTQQELEGIDAELAQLTNTWIKRLFMRTFNSHQGHREWLEERRKSLIQRLVIIEKRRGDEACLVCGSRRLQSFTGDYSLETDGTFSYVGSKPSGFIHPGCDGEFIATGSDIRFHFARITYCYSPEGELIEERWP